MLTKCQIQASTHITSLLDTTADCLRFVTEFFDVINQSAPHIYHSALFLTPKLSIVWKLYSEQICPLVARVVTGIPTSWDSCTASAGGYDTYSMAWSPCGQFIATGVLGLGQAQVLDSITLGRVSVLNSPSNFSHSILTYPTFSPDGHQLACFQYM